jgi:hypothetical protein
MPEPERSGGGFAAIALIVVGLLILIPSGLCTGAVTIFSLWGALAGHGSGATGIVGMALTIGGPFVAIGGVLTWLGFRMRRRR